MWRALAESHIRPDLIVGTSVGALNGAFIAARPDPGRIDALAAVWRSLRRRDIFPIGILRGALGYYGVRDALVNPAHLRHLVDQHLPLRRLEDAEIPLHVVATDVLTGAEVVLSRGDAVEAVLASAAIPAVFPPVVVDGRALMDGGVSDNTPISHAVALGASTVYVLPAGYPCAIASPPRTALGMALQALTVMIGRRLSLDVERFAGQCDLHVVPPLCPLDVRPHDFSRAAELIAKGYDSTRKWIDKGMKGSRHQAKWLRPHIDRPAEPSSAAASP
jgi:NTE family protein